MAAPNGIGNSKTQFAAAYIAPHCFNVGLFLFHCYRFGELFIIVLRD
jgi:hypothetical protein